MKKKNSQRPAAAVGFADAPIAAKTAFATDWLAELEAAHTLLRALWQRAEAEGAQGVQCYLTNAMEYVAAAYETERRRSPNDRSEPPHERVGMPLAKDMRNPLAKARDHWLESAEGKRCADPTTLPTTYLARHYLENRLVSAFLAGANWMASQKQKGEAPNDPNSPTPARSPEYSTKEQRP